MLANLNQHLYSYKTKVVGMVIAAIAFSMLIIHNYVTPIIFTSSESETVNGSYIHIALVVGLFIMMNSKEKIEDERIILIRGRATIMAFRMLLVLVLSRFIASLPFETTSALSVYSVKLWVYFTFAIYFISFYSSFYLNRDITTDGFLRPDGKVLDKGYKNLIIRWWFIPFMIAFLIFSYFVFG